MLMICTPQKAATNFKIPPEKKYFNTLEKKIETEDDPLLQNSTKKNTPVL